MESSEMKNQTEVVVAGDFELPQSGGYFGSLAGEERTLVHVSEELETPVGYIQACEVNQELQHSEIWVQEYNHPEVQEYHPGVPEVMESSDWEVDMLTMLPRYTSESLFVTDLHPSSIDKLSSLHDLFSQVGEVSIVKFIHNSKPADTAGRPSPLYSAYVNFHTVEEACRAWQTLRYTVWNGSPMRIMFSNLDPAARYNDKANIIVMNLAESIDSEALHHTFCKFGVVLSCKVELDSNGQSTGQGYIQFQDEEAAQEAIKKVNKQMLEDKVVYVGPFIRRTDHSKSDQKNRNSIDLNPAHVKVENPSQPVKETREETEVLERPIDDAVVFVAGSGSHHNFRFGSFEPPSISHDFIGATDGAVSFPSSSPGASTSNLTSEGGTEDNTRPSGSKERRKRMKRQTSAQRNKARRTAILQKALDEASKGKSAYVPSAEPWPPQPWSVETLRRRVSESQLPDERRAMVGGTLLPLVSKHTNCLATDVTNELVILDMDGVEKFMKLSEEAMFQKVEEVKQVILEKLRNQPPFVPTTRATATTPSPPPATTDDGAATVDEVPPVVGFAVPVVPEFFEAPASPSVEVPPVVGYAVSVVPEFFEAPAAGKLTVTIPVTACPPMLEFPMLQPPMPFPRVLPQCVVDYPRYREGPGTGFFEPRVRISPGIYSIPEAQGEGQE